VRLTLTEAGAEGGFTVTVAEATAVDDAALLAVTVRLEVAVTLGAVSRPLLVIEPAVVDHVTLVLLEPLTVAVNCDVAPEATDAVAGLTLTVTVGVAVGFTVTVAEALASSFAALFAVTVT
jgi:hypothetical protein